MQDFLRYCQIRLDLHSTEQLTNIGGKLNVELGPKNWITS